MNAKEEILDYINRKEMTGALLLTGKWGCGKSYLIKEIAKELNDSKKAAISIISLFGLDSVSSINKRVRDEYTSYVIGGTFGNTAKKISKAVVTLAKDGLAVANTATGGMSGLAAASQGIAAVMNYDVFGFFDVKNTVGKDDKERSFVLVFDDLERSNLAKKDLLGTLNEYVENKQIKTIVVADEEKIDSDEYMEYKEKLISRTIRMESDYDTLIDCIINGYSETSEGYKSFLLENIELLKQVFIESNSDNLRTFKTILADFERVYSAWRETDVSSENMKWVLYTFAAGVFNSKVPPQKESPQFAFIGKNLSSLFVLSDWIKEGIWEKESFMDELKKRYEKHELSPMERFLTYQGWVLQQNDIDIGLPEAVELAYKGDLSRDELIKLIKNVHFLNSNSITIPCVISYSRIVEGLKKRFEKIKKGEIVEPTHRFLSPHDELDEEANQLLELIKKMEDKMNSWKIRKQFIDYLQGTPDSSRLFHRGQCIDEFDDELFEIFIKQYEQASNEDKMDYSGALLGFSFDDPNCSTEENMDASRGNFKKLIKRLKDQNDSDEITMLINKEFVSKIQKINLMLEDEF